MISIENSDRAFVTSRGLMKIEAELAYLRDVKLPEIIDRLEETRIGSDPIDNTEFMTAEDERALVAGRIIELTYILNHAELIQPGQADGLIRLGSTVVVQEEGASMETYMVVGSVEANPVEGTISNLSPLGRALLNHTIGDDVEVKTPEGIKRFRIIAVK